MAAGLSHSYLFFICLDEFASLICNENHGEVPPPTPPKGGELAARHLCRSCNGKPELQLNNGQNDNSPKN